METRNLIASIFATVFTATTLGVVNYNVPVTASPPATTPSHQQTAPVINLAPVLVTPTPAERRAAALLTNIRVNHAVNDSSLAGSGSTAPVRRMATIKSPLLMPYYSFGNQIGGISKE